jgi:hypothetical protein
MKKVILISIVCVLGFKGIRAEGGTDYVPHAGNFSIGFDVSPLFNFLGNIFNGTIGNEMEPLAGTPAIVRGGGILPSASIMAKYMYTDNFAIIGNIGLLGRNTTSRVYVRDDRAYALDPFTGDRLIDVGITKRNGISALLGGEYRVGESRIQGVFGGGLMFAFAKSHTSFQWANQMTNFNQNPTTSFGGLVGNGMRTLETFGTTPTIYFGLATHAGVEYFIAPRVSIGAVVNLHLLRERGAQTYMKTERFNPATDRVDVWTDLVSPGNRTTLWGTENLGGSLYISFYF